MHISFEEKSFHGACASLTDLDLAAAGKTASTAAGSGATAARAALPGPTSLFSGFKSEIYRPAGFKFVISNLGVSCADLRRASVVLSLMLDAVTSNIQKLRVLASIKMLSFPNAGRLAVCWRR